MSSLFEYEQSLFVFSPSSVKQKRKQRENASAKMAEIAVENRGSGGRLRFPTAIFHLRYFFD